MTLSSRYGADPADDEMMSEAKRIKDGSPQEIACRLHESGRRPAESLRPLTRPSTY